VTRPRVLVVSSCTGLKAHADGAVLQCADFARGRSYVEGRHRRDLATALLPAEDLYRGQQHLRLMRGVHAARDAGTIDIDLRIVSAGYGVVRGSDPLAPYECTFQGMPRGRRREWARGLAIPEATRAALATRSDLTVVLLGDEYLDSCRLDSTLTLGGPTLVFCASRSALRLPALARLQVVRLKTAQTRRFRCGLVGLKGEVGGRLLAYLADEPSRLNHITAPALLDDLAGFGPTAGLADSDALALL
jgi:hypothetical protein